ncbi:PH domain-containing protein [Paenisporosarcina sp. NPDC076898]|uniref:PH domain-containing protein n=1 Tax=unclassified Paenisporosarcina TaxID=2642018 RepID=UPI003D02A4E4
MEFRSIIDKFFVGIISITVFIILGVFLIPLLLDYDRTSIDTITVLSLCVLSIGVLLWSAFSIKYVLFNDHLFVKGGLFKSRIPYEDITRISPTTEIFTGYRLLSSKQGIELFYKSATLGSVKISPKDIDLFIFELEKRASNVQIDKITQ